MAGPGHNSALGRRVKGWIARLQELDAEIKDSNKEKSGVFQEAKTAGVDPADIRNAMRFLRDPDAARERGTRTNDILRLLDVVELPALPAPTPGITITQDGMPDATRAHVHVREGDDRSDAA